VDLVREDLEQLAEWLDPRSPTSLEAKIDRIVLYVDDLDRCAPRRVVEVLQAVHLLLAFPIFVVVVAVDHHWLLTSLESTIGSCSRPTMTRDLSCGTNGT
jgi:hypothetical protein